MSDNTATLCASQLGFHAVTGFYHCPIGGRDPIFIEMENLGITWFKVMPDRFGDCYWFFNCRNVPDNLPEWLYKREVTAQSWIGRSAMTQEIADEILLESAKP